MIWIKKWIFRVVPCRKNCRVDEKKMDFSLAWYVFFLFLPTVLPAQATDWTVRDPLAGRATGGAWLRPDTTFNARRFWTAAGTGAALYGTASVGLYHAWYAGFERRGLRGFNDWPEWLQMDKAGHLFTAYFFSRYAYAGARWAGLRRPPARWAAFGVANLLQTTIEVMDGHSAGWGFSWSDMGANVAGSLVFTLQDVAWREQRILLKVSNDLRPVPDAEVRNAGGAVSNLGVPVRQRFGTHWAERYLKDYNAQTIWASVNLRSFAPRSGLPEWLNLAVGYGAENVYGAYGNSWTEGGAGFRWPEERYRQWFLSPDVYFSRIPTRKRWVRLLLGALDTFKLPAPGLEYGNGRLRARWLAW